MVGSKAFVGRPSHGLRAPGAIIHSSGFYSFPRGSASWLGIVKALQGKVRELNSIQHPTEPIKLRTYPELNGNLESICEQNCLTITIF